MAHLSRSEYTLALTPCGSPEEGTDPEVALRSVVATDGDMLAELLLAAYRGTIDDEGEELPEAEAAIAAFFANSPLIDASVIASVDGTAVSAVLVSERDDGPFISYVVTGPTHKRAGLATRVVASACRRLLERGDSHARFVITDGNVASETLFANLGAIRRRG